MNTKNPKAYDLLGSIALVRFPKEFKQKEKKKFADGLLKNQKPIKTVLEKYGKIKGRLRKIQTRHLAGEKTKEVLYRENNCVFRFNIDTTYFSPRLSNERKEIAQKIKKGQEVLVMFAGVSPYSIVIAKSSKAKKVYSNEINREANKYAKLNIRLNKLKDKVELIPGDVKRIFLSVNSPPTLPWKSKNINSKSIEMLSVNKSVNAKNSGKAEFEAKYKSRARRAIPKKFDVIVMPRPQLKDSFLKEAFTLSKKETTIYYYDFCGEDEIESIIEKIKQEAKSSKKKIKILNKKSAGEIAPYKIRLRVDFKIL
tara:strand:+ start:318 stop:1250 length:933 start_codon:yes stop_codon:yes gene_type:complete